MAAIGCHAMQLGASPMMRASTEWQWLFFGTDTLRGPPSGSLSGIS